MAVRTPLTGANASREVDTVPAGVDPTGRFSVRAELYRLHRPTYPGEQILPMLVQECALGDAIASGSGPVAVADVGSGTGISTKLFLTSPSMKEALEGAGRSMIVYGVEPNAPMRQGAEEDLREHEVPADGSALEVGHVYFKSIDGSAEQTGLPDSSIDMIVAFQAGHWFESQQTIAEFRRILRRGSGKPNLALAWNTRPPPDPASESEVLGMQIHERHRMHDAGGAQASSAERHTRIANALFGPPPAGGKPTYEVRTFPHALPFTLEGVKGFWHSISFMPQAGTEAGDALDAELGRLFDMVVAEQKKPENEGKDRDQVVDLKFETYVFFGVI
ncbi:hypothetical protein DFJ74DRAFT_703422 [Hyaloraphidium curvatum]|nr:hypothetical protein DFJ74DRAFT_703422 [Hyaloraphidium curvatum]